MEASFERELLTKARKGDRAAFAGLVEEYRHLILTLAYQMTGSAADMDDVAQETFMRAFQNLKNFRGEASFKTWLVKIALNLTSNYRRSRTSSKMTDITEKRTLSSLVEGQDQQILNHELRVQVCAPV